MNMSDKPDMSVDYLEMAKGRLDECRRLRENRLPNRMIARFAYLCLLYSALTMLDNMELADNFDIDAPLMEHERMISLFHVNFVNRGIAPPETSDALSSTFEIWEDNDRNPKTTVTDEDTDGFLRQAEILLAVATDYIEPKGI